MELRQFIKEVIYSLADGISDAIEHQEEHDVVVNPQVTAGNSPDHLHMPKTAKGYERMERQVQHLDLDVSFAVSEGTEQQGGGHISLFNVMSIGVGGSDIETSVHQQRLHISVPICLPASKIPSMEETIQ